MYLSLSTFRRFLQISYLYATESVGWGALCPEGSSLENDSQNGGCKVGVRFPFVPLGFGVHVWTSLGLQQFYGEGKKKIDFCELFLMEISSCFVLLRPLAPDFAPSFGSSELLT